MTIVSGSGVKRLLPAVLGLMLAIAAASFIALADAKAQPASQPDASSGSGATLADDEFSRQLNDLKRSFGEVGKQIESGTQAIDKLKSPEEGRKGIVELRQQVSKLLGTVADNGEVARLGRMALDRADQKLKSLAEDTRFRPEEREYLVQRWRDLRASTASAIKELDVARRDFAELLRTLQTSEDYIDELLQIREHEKALDVIHNLTSGIRDASDKLKRLLGGLRPPTA
jgi:hypothetical protein